MHAQVAPGSVHLCDQSSGMLACDGVTQLEVGRFNFASTANGALRSHFLI